MNKREQELFNEAMEIACTFEMHLKDIKSGSGISIDHDAEGLYIETRCSISNVNVYIDKMDALREKLLGKY